MNEQKQKNSEGGAPGRRGKKTGLIILAILVLLAGGWLAMRHQEDMQHSSEQAIRRLFDEDRSLLNSSNYNSWLNCFKKVRNKKSFQEDLARAFSEQLEEGVDKELLSEALMALGKAGYEDENVRDTVVAYYTMRKEQILARMDPTDPKSIFNTAESLNFNANAIQDDVNRYASDFYKITGIYTEAEVRDLFVQAAEAYRDAGDLEHLTYVLCTPLKFRDNGSKEGDDDYTAPIAYLDPQEIFDLYAGSTEAVYTILSGQGGYYDYSRGPSGVSDSEDYHYGDFFYEAHKKGGKTYDMTEFGKNPGLWDSIGKDLQDAILSANTEANSKVITCCFRGRQIIHDKPAISALYEAGFEYAVQSKDGESFVFLSPAAICLDGSSRNVVFGDFSKQYEQLRDFYTGGPSVDAPSASALANSTPLSQQLENPDPSLAPFVPYCGLFEGERGSFISDFYLSSDGLVFWTAAPAEEGGALPFTVSEFGEPVALYTGPCLVKRNNAIPSTENVLLTASDSIGVQYQMAVIFSNNYIAAITSIKTPDSPAFDTYDETGFNKAA